VPESNTESDGWSGRLQRAVGAWQPFTGGGIASFASASASRILLFQIFAAAAIGGLFVWALRTAWVPVIEQGLTRLPESALLQSGQLAWPGTQPIRISENEHLDWIVTPAAASPLEPLGQSADLQIELRPRSLRIRGTLGHVEIPYPAAWRFDFGRIPATASWNAWRSYLGMGVGIVVALGLLLSWWTLATAYAVPGWIFARLVRRHPSLPGVWRMAAAALWMGALVASGGIAAYAYGLVRIPGLIATQAIHIPIPWIWFAWGILRSEASVRTSKVSGPGRKRRPRNPFNRR